MRRSELQWRLVWGGGPPNFGQRTAEIGATSSWQKKNAAAVTFAAFRSTKGSTRALERACFRRKTAASSRPHSPRRSPAATPPWVGLFSPTIEEEAS